MKKFAFVAVLAAIAGAAQAQSYSMNFDAGSDFTDWSTSNESIPAAAVAGWAIGSSTAFPANSGTSYALSNFQRGTGLSDLSTWLFTPTRVLNNGDTFSFFTRTSSVVSFPDRLRVALSTSGASTLSADFSTVLLSINENLNFTDYPTSWTQFTITLSGLSGPTSGRIAFNYNVPSGGPLGDNSDIIGVDDVSYVAVPAPGALALVGLGGLVVGRRRR